MMDYLIKLDQQLFLLINRVMVNDFFDWLLPLFRSKYFWAPLYLFLIVYFINKYKLKGLWIILFLIITFAITDFISASIIKEYYQRLRPCNEPEFMGMVRNLVGCGSGYSFISSHASNHFGFAYFMLGIFHDKVWVRRSFLLWAAVISYAQVYVGVHYPIDVILGMYLGMLIGTLTFYIFNKFIHLDVN